MIPVKFECDQLLRKKNFNNDNSALIKASIAKSRNLISKTHYLKAIKLLESLISQGIAHSDIYYLLGESYRLLENYEKSEENLHKSLLMKIHPPHAYFSLGKLYQSQLRYREAIQQFQEFLKRIENADGHYELGRSFM